MFYLANNNSAYSPPEQVQVGRESYVKEIIDLKAEYNSKISQLEYQID